MGTIKDLVDLTAQLANSVQDRKIASEMNSIQALISKLQSEQASVHEENTRLREERLSLKERLQELETKIKEMKSSSIEAPSNIPKCPNCSTATKPFFMRPVPRDFVDILKATHECPNCEYSTSYPDVLGRS